MDADAWMAGEFSGPWGRYWTPIDPRRIRDYRNIAGLPIENKGRLLCCEDAHLSSGPCSCADLVELMHAPARPPRRVRNPSSQQSKGRFLIVGELIDPRGIRVERAAPIGSNPGGVSGIPDTKSSSPSPYFASNRFESPLLTARVLETLRGR